MRRAIVLMGIALLPLPALHAQGTESRRAAAVMEAIVRSQRYPVGQHVITLRSALDSIVGLSEGGIDDLRSRLAEVASVGAITDLACRTAAADEGRRCAIVEITHYSDLGDTVATTTSWYFANPNGQRDICQGYHAVTLYFVVEQGSARMARAGPEEYGDKVCP